MKHQPKQQYQQQLIKWPIEEDLRWFVDKSPIDIIINEDDKFMRELKQHSLKIVTNLNKSFHEKIDAWLYLSSFKDTFHLIFKACIRLALSISSPTTTNDNHDKNNRYSQFNLTLKEQYQILTFFNYAFNSIEVDFVHQQIRKYLPLSIWINLSKVRREIELNKLSKRIRLAWENIERQDLKLSENDLIVRNFERKFMFNYVKQFFNILDGAILDENEDLKGQDNGTSQENDEMDVDTNGIEAQGQSLNEDSVLYCQRFLEFIIDLESQLPLRRFFHAILEYTNFIVRCQMSDLARHKSPEGHLFEQLVDLLLLYTRYDLDLMSGEPVGDMEILRKHEDKILQLQKVLWSNYKHLKKYSIKPIKAIDNPSTLYKIITSFDSREELFEFLKSLNLVDEENITGEDQYNAPLLASIMMNYYRRYESQIRKINAIPLFPNESVIWDTNLVPDQYYNYECPLALPKLNLQYLTISDYLLRNFMLFKNESTYEIRQDIEDGIVRSKCKWTDQGNFATGPKQRMALILKDFSITDVEKPHLGQNCPSKVRAKIIINMDYVKPEWRREWEQLRKHDTCFLVSFRKPTEQDASYWPEGSFPNKNGIKYVRGCEIEGLLDSDGKLVDENLENPNFINNLRTFMVLLDCNQYKMDQDLFNSKKITVYDKFHMIVRRKPEKNNFKGVLETIRSLINTKFVVPDWLKNLLLGFGDPTDAHHSKLVPEDQTIELDYYDTFLSLEHLENSMRVLRPDYELCICSKSKGPAVPPFKMDIKHEDKKITVKPYKIPPRGPYPTVKPRENKIEFTPTQVEAITSGMQTGLTMVVGPPGTGKTDVAVQILSTLYHSNPEQRTLIVTHSNQALNQIFEKMIALDVKEHHLLRMGHGEEELESDKDFSRQGRVKYVLARRLELLILVGKLARSLGLDPGQGFTCESAEYFHFYHIISRWNEYMDTIRRTKDPGSICDKFPFTNFFDDAPQPLFKGVSTSEDFEVAKSCYRYIKNIFEDLQSFRPFEIFSNASDRSKYLLIREAKVIAMTCTHAGLRRKELVEMNFQYDNILMEETAQILEIETAIPLLLQNPENGVNRLKRWIMIGDHNQLPPIIQNSTFQKFSNLEQSLFARFIRLGVPAVELDAQGRARSSLCDLYRWRYRNLSDLKHVNVDSIFKKANAGFVYDYQLINVDEGVGETTPMPYYYQNQTETDYVLATYKYMRTLGYPNEKITILTTYNGQKQLLRDIFEKECTSDVYLGRPSKITTVDKFQGQQNDFVLLSLVRTRTIGHLRDIRRLIVAMSRARLGLYIFAKVSMFSGYFELQRTMQFLLSRPQSLCLIGSDVETFPTDRILYEDDENGAKNLLLPDSGSILSVKNLTEFKSLVNDRYNLFMEEQSKLFKQRDKDEEDSHDEEESL